MKKILLSLLTVAAFTASATAQDLVIKGKDGSSIDLNLTDLRKITFSAGNMVTRYSDGTYSEYALSTIGRLAFEETTGMSAIEIMDGHLAYSAQTGTALVTNSEGEVLIVYSISGKIALQKKITSEQETVDLSGLSNGIYLLKLNGVTIKIVK